MEGQRILVFVDNDETRVGKEEAEENAHSG
jgi:hypothetical protein